MPMIERPGSSRCIAAWMDDPSSMRRYIQVYKLRVLWLGAVQACGALQIWAWPHARVPLREGGNVSSAPQPMFQRHAAPQMREEAHAGFTHRHRRQGLMAPASSSNALKAAGGWAPADRPELAEERFVDKSSTHRARTATRRFCSFMHMAQSTPLQRLSPHPTSGRALLPMRHT